MEECALYNQVGVASEAQTVGRSRAVHRAKRLHWRYSVLSAASDLSSFFHERAARWASASNLTIVFKPVEPPLLRLRPLCQAKQPQSWVKSFRMATRPSRHGDRSIKSSRCRLTSWRNTTTTSALSPVRPLSRAMTLALVQIWNDPKGLTALQKYCVQAHVDDIRAAARSTGRLQRARTSPVYSIVRYLYIVTTLVFKTFLSNPTVPFTDPVNWAFSLVAYGTIFVVLTFLQVVFTIGACRCISGNDVVPSDAYSAGYLLGAPHLIKWLSQKYGNGQVLVTMASPEFYTNKTPIFAEAIKVLSTAAPKVPDVPGLRNDGSLETDKRTRQDVIVFNTDVAKAMVTMCTLVCGSLCCGSVHGDDLADRCGAQMNVTTIT